MWKSVAKLLIFYQITDKLTLLFVTLYADKLSISPRYLANLCKTVSGKSTKEWIDEYVMNDVRRYLIRTDLSIKEVATRTLFTNFSFFSKMVKNTLV
ncbi:MAG: AraC family transcriptional regulator [Bacteroides sp.]|nr:AraC family transcriptional regulator [Bacteroides sp.]